MRRYRIKKEHYTGIISTDIIETEDIEKFIQAWNNAPGMAHTITAYEAVVIDPLVQTQIVENPTEGFLGTLRKYEKK